MDSFLADVKRAIERDEYEFTDRQSTRNTFTRLGCTEQDAIDKIKELTYDDYFMGPKPNEHKDRDDVWEFKTNFEYRIIYIKLEIVYQDNKELLVWSFHPDGERN